MPIPNPPPPMPSTPLSAEEKLRALAVVDTALSAALGSAGIFRWFDRRLPQGYITQGTCVRIRRVSTVRQHTQRGLSTLAQPLFQIDVLDLDPVTARKVAAEIIAFLGRISLAHPNQFDSVVTTPPQFPNFLLNERAGMEPQLQPPVYVESLDVRVYDETSI